MRAKKTYETKVGKGVHDDVWCFESSKVNHYAAVRIHVLDIKYYISSMQQDDMLSPRLLRRACVDMTMELKGDSNKCPWIL